MFKVYAGFISLALISVLGVIAFGGHSKPSVNALFEDKVKQSAVLHDKALERIKSECNVPDQVWNKTIQAIENAIATDDLFSSKKVATKSDAEQPWIAQTIKKIALECGMNPDRITVKFVNAPGVNLQAIQDFDENNKIIHLLEINLEWCNRHSQQMQEAFARHEMMHLYNYDAIEDGYITYMLDTLGQKPEDSAKHPAMINFRHAREFRADLLAGCNSSTIAHALCDHYTQDIPLDIKRPLEAHMSHPTAQDRVTQLTQLMIQMDNQPKLV